MSGRRSDRASERLELVRLVAHVGAMTDRALARREGASVASARGRLLAAERVGWLRSSRLLSGSPALFLATGAGMRAAGVSGLEPVRVSTANARHLTACAAAAGELARAYPNHDVAGEQELRREERRSGRPLASAWIGPGREQLHRPDLVLWPATRRERLPVAVEVELSVKSPPRLLGICRAWARCRCVAGVLYLCSPEAMRALGRAVEEAQAGARIAVLSLDELAGESRRELESPIAVRP